uniref:Uncharacterized protein n=1 Tax=Anguilla anguilla TaxID=7936 RepID=A0A0E9W4K1_ANGAN
MAKIKIKKDFFGKSKCEHLCVEVPQLADSFMKRETQTERKYAVKAQFVSMRFTHSHTAQKTETSQTYTTFIYSRNKIKH